MGLREWWDISQQTEKATLESQGKELSLRTPF